VTARSCPSSKTADLAKRRGDKWLFNAVLFCLKHFLEVVTVPVIRQHPKGTHQADFAGEGGGSPRIFPACPGIFCPRILDNTSHVCRVPTPCPRGGDPHRL
jgi:hypothetical protein